MSISKLKNIFFNICCLMFISLQNIQCMDEVEEGKFYQIKNKYSRACLDSYGNNTGNGSASMFTCAQDEHQNNRLWRFEKVDGYYKIHNKYSENCLGTNGTTSGEGAACMFPCTQDKHAQNILWFLEKEDDSYTIQSKYNEYCLHGPHNPYRTGREEGIVSMCTCAQDESAMKRLWYFRENDKKSIQSLGNNTAIIFGNSFFYGASYTLFQEIIKETLVYLGHTNSEEYVKSIMTVISSTLWSKSISGSVTIGILAKILSSELNFSDETSAIVGSTATVVSNVFINYYLSSNHESITDCLTNCAVSFAGSSIGSYIVFKAKSRFLGLLRNNSLVH